MTNIHLMESYNGCAQNQGKLAEGRFNLVINIKMLLFAKCRDIIIHDVAYKQAPVGL